MPRRYSQRRARQGQEAQARRSGQSCAAACSWPQHGALLPRSGPLGPVAAEAVPGRSCSGEPPALQHRHEKPPRKDPSQTSVSTMTLAAAARLHSPRLPKRSGPSARTGAEPPATAERSEPPLRSARAWPIPDRATAWSATRQCWRRATVRSRKTAPAAAAHSPSSPRSAHSAAAGGAASTSMNSLGCWSPATPRGRRAARAAPAAAMARAPGPAAAPPSAAIAARR
mmetsp:Transcript_104301/g.232965  ORF Transcript_104301/g.232965 Transcript_104301/m.232965 type:complete len:227 (+) Transcript_104301:705-1385(+)